jgi:hypothetical protein
MSLWILVFKSRISTAFSGKTPKLGGAFSIRRSYSIMKHGIIFWSNSPNSKMIFTLAGVKSRTSCGNLFMGLKTLPLPCEYIFTLMNFAVNNQEHFQTNSAIHNVNTRNRNHLHRPTANLSCFQKGAYYAGIKMFNSLPSNLISLTNKGTQFKVTLKRYLNITLFTLLGYS